MPFTVTTEAAEKCRRLENAANNRRLRRLKALIKTIKRRRSRIETDYDLDCIAAREWLEAQAITDSAK